MAVEDEMEAATPAPRETETSELEPETFDLAAWAAGVRRARHTVRLYARGDLLADLDVLRAQIRDAGLTGDKTKLGRLRRQAHALVEEMESSALDVVVEARSASWIRAFADERRDMDETDRAVEMICAQVVEPAGFTPDLYRQLSEVIEPQVQQIAAAVVAVNSRTVDVSVPS